MRVGSGQKRLSPLVGVSGLPLTPKASFETAHFAGSKLPGSVPADFWPEPTRALKSTKEVE